MQYQHIKDHQERKREQGICRDCTKPATQGVFCKEHRDKYDAVTRENRRERKENGVCIICGGRLSEESSNYCNTHTEYFRKRQELSDVAVYGALYKILGKRRINKENLIKIKSALKKMAGHSDLILDDQQKIILDYRITSEYPESHKQLAKRLGGIITRQRVQQIESTLSKKLYNYLQNKRYLVKLRSLI